MIASRRRRRDPGPGLVFAVVCGPAVLAVLGALLLGLPVLVVVAAVVVMTLTVWSVVIACDRGRR